MLFTEGFITLISLTIIRLDNGKTLSQTKTINSATDMSGNQLPFTFDEILIDENDVGEEVQLKISLNRLD